MADDMQFGALNPQLLLQPRLQLAQSLIQQGTDTSPIRSPWQGAARLAQALAGTYIQNQTADQYGSLQKDANQQLAAASQSKDPMAAIANSSNPLLRAMLPTLVQKQLENNLALKMKNAEPFSLKPGETRYSQDGSGTGVTPLTSAVPATEVGKLMSERDALPQGDPRRAAYDAQIGKMGQEGGISFGPNGAAAVPGVGAAKANLASALLPVELQKAAGEANIRAATTPTNVTVGNRADVPVSQAAAIAMGQAPGQPGAAFAPNGIPGIQPIPAPPPMSPQQIPTALNAMPQNPAAAAPQQAQQPAMPSGIGPQATGGVPKIQPDMPEKPPLQQGVPNAAPANPILGKPVYDPSQMPITPDQKIAAEQRAQKDFLENPQVKEHYEVGKNYRSVLQAAQGNDKASDINLIDGLVKMFNPGATVRQSTFENFMEHSQGIPDNVVGIVKSWYGNGAHLAPETRQQLVDQATGRMDSSRQSYNQLANFVQQAGTNQGLNVSNILPKYIDPLTAKEILAQRMAAKQAGGQQ